MARILFRKSYENLQNKVAIATPQRYRKQNLLSTSPQTSDCRLQANFTACLGLWDRDVLGRFQPWDLKRRYMPQGIAMSRYHTWVICLSTKFFFVSVISRTKHNKHLVGNITAEAGVSYDVCSCKMCCDWILLAFVSTFDIPEPLS